MALHRKNLHFYLYYSILLSTSTKKIWNRKEGASFLIALKRAVINLSCMIKYKTKPKKNQDLLNKHTKKKRKNGVLAYFMKSLVSEATLDRKSTRLNSSHVAISY